MNEETVGLVTAIIGLIAAIIGLVAVIQALMEWRSRSRTSGSAPSDGPPGSVVRRGPGWVRPKLLAGVVSLAVAIFAASWLLGRGDDENGDPSPTATAAPTIEAAVPPVVADPSPTRALPSTTPTVAPVAEAPVSGAPFDDFESGVLSPDRWREDDPGDLIGVDGRALHLKLQSATEATGYAAATALTEGRPLEGVTFDLTSLSATAGSEASAGIDVFVDDLHWVSLKTGPGDQGVGMEISFCPDPSSTVEPVQPPGYGECENLSGVRPSPGTPLPVEIVQTGEVIAVRVNGSTLFERPGYGAPFTSFEFNVRGTEGSSMHATVDNVRLEFAGG